MILSVMVNNFNSLSVYRDFFDEIDYKYKDLPINIEIEAALKIESNYRSKHAPYSTFITSTMNLINSLYYEKISSEFFIKCVRAKLIDNDSKKIPIQGIDFNDKAWAMDFLSKYGKLIAEINLRKMNSSWDMYIFLENSIYGNTAKRHVADIIESYKPVKTLMQLKTVNEYERQYINLNSTNLNGLLSEICPVKL